MVKEVTKTSPDSRREELDSREREVLKNQERKGIIDKARFLRKWKRMEFQGQVLHVYKTG